MLELNVIKVPSTEERQEFLVLHEKDKFYVHSNGNVILPTTYTYKNGMRRNARDSYIHIGRFGAEHGKPTNDISLHQGDNLISRKQASIYFHNQTKE